jgi:hypothetical protein
LRDELRDYARNVIDKSWPLQRQGIVPTEESHLMTKFIDDLVSFEPSKRSEEILHAETLRQLNSQVELRRSRLANVTAGIPAVLWWVVALGAVISIILLAMLDMEIHVHVILGAAVSLFLGVVIFPYRGNGPSVSRRSQRRTGCVPNDLRLPDETE